MDSREKIFVCPKTAIGFPILKRQQTMHTPQMQFSCNAPKAGTGLSELGNLLRRLSLCLMLVSGALLAQDKGQPEPRLPLVSGVSEILFLDNARHSLERARQREGENRMLDAVQAYEALIDESAKLSPALLHTYEFHIVLAASHLDAARTRIAYGVSFAKILDPTEQNRRLITGHLDAIPALIVAAAKEASGSANFDQFRCNAFKLLAHGQFLMGSLNQSPSYLNGAVKAYERVAQCDSESEKSARQMISHIKGVKRDITNSPGSYDNLTKATAGLVKIAIPKGGAFLAFGIQRAPDYYKAHRSIPEPPKVR